MHNIWNKTVLVTGSESMIGRAICESLEKRECDVIYVPHASFDLLNLRQTQTLFTMYEPEYVIHAAGYNGGIQFNLKYPADVYEQTVRMGLNVLKVAAQTGSVQKIVSILTSCSYPDLQVDELAETEIWSGKPHLSIECHGLSKRVLLDYSRQINRQFGKLTVCCALNNSYGPYDWFDINKTKVLCAMIRRFVEATQRGTEVTLWGTGCPLREFMFCKDAGEAIVQTLEKYDIWELPINLSSGEEVSIKQLAAIIAEATDYQGEIYWDVTKPDGQMKKKLDITSMYEYLDVPITSLKSGVKQTVKWYLDNQEEANARVWNPSQ